MRPAAASIKPMPIAGRIMSAIFLLMGALIGVASFLHWDDMGWSGLLVAGLCIGLPCCIHAARRKQFRQQKQHMITSTECTQGDQGRQVSEETPPPTQYQPEVPTPVLDEVDESLASLDKFIWNNHFESFEAQLKQVKKINGLYEGRTLLHSAALCLQPSMVKLLLIAGADASALNDAQITPLQCAKNVAQRDGADWRFDAISYMLTFGKPCSECDSGAPELTGELYLSSSSVGIQRAYVCKEGHRNYFPPSAVNRANGIYIMCHECMGNSALVPASVWCKTCRGGFVLGWQKLLKI